MILGDTGFIQSSRCSHCDLWIQCFFQSSPSHITSGFGIQSFFQLRRNIDASGFNQSSRSRFSCTMHDPYKPPADEPFIEPKGMAAKDLFAGLFMVWGFGFACGVIAAIVWL